MADEILKTFPGNLANLYRPTQTVERLKPEAIDIVARVLASAYVEDPIHLWAMPKADTRLSDATLFFKFYLRRKKLHSWNVFATTDRSAVVVLSLVRKGNKAYPDGVRHLPKLIRSLSPVNDYFEWIETFRPKFEHYHLEFIGCLSTQRSRGLGSLLLGSVLAMADREGIPTWSWSSNSRNLPFYRRLGFEIGPELRRDANTPPVTIITRPVMPLTDGTEKS